MLFCFLWPNLETSIYEILVGTVTVGVTTMELRCSFCFSNLPYGVCPMVFDVVYLFPFIVALNS